jgi:hypothetical protein
MRRARPALARPLPRTRLLPNLVTDGFGQGRLRVYMNQAAYRVVALRSQTVLTGSGSHRTLLRRGSGEDTHISARIPTACGNPGI